MLFPPDFLTRLEYLSIMSKRVFRGSLLAQRRTMQMGSGIEFSDHREYTNGDDLRYLDWNVYARYGDLLLKRFQEERDLHVYLLVDCSQSMAFGSPAKFDLARQLAAALAYIALADLDRISILAYGDRIMTELPVTRGKAQILSVMKYLEGIHTGGEDTNLSRGVQDFLLRGPRTGLVVVLSDLFDPHGFRSGLDQLRYRRFDAHVIQLHDPQEANPQMLGDVEFVDIETQSARKVTVTEKNLRTYKKLFDEHQAAVRTYCKTYGWGCTQSPSNVPFDDLLVHMMRSSIATARS
ncbi:DUF58 domain-containing protein [Bremerella cremea]|uniref:DUF58 domain-containing protein n=2 Tax=Pirellulales TaxID=2691354 RepID=A0A2S8G7T9_9BACT|nr:DUF58 domain-containing protein [Blastopirellula marina]RCS52107.1 DUF58 domain-containing protein [Bremerella cremea]